MAKLLMNIKKMQEDRKAWLKMRQKGIGGSDAGVILGLNPYKSRYRLWQEKIGAVDIEEKDNEYMYWGRVLEGVIAKRYTELTGEKLVKRGLLQHDNYPYILASVDRMLVSKNEGLEIKTGGAYQEKNWRGEEVPDSYYVQCLHYMLVTGARRWHIAALIGGNHLIIKTIERNQDDIMTLLEAEERFWLDYVIKQKEPPPDGSSDYTNALMARYKDVKKEQIELPPEAEMIIKELDTLLEHKKDMEIGINLRKNKLCSMLRENEAGRVRKRKVYWKLVEGKTTIDIKKLQQDEPKIYQKYAKKGASYRLFRLK